MTTTTATTERPSRPGGKTSTVALLKRAANLVTLMGNEEFGLFSRWLVTEANTRTARVISLLSKGDEVVFVNMSDKLTEGRIVRVGAKNALVKTENGGKLFVPLSRLQKKTRSRIKEEDIPTIASLPSSAPPRPMSPPKRTRKAAADGS